MHQTTKYKFNLIETSDAFGPEKLNENAETAERELAAEAAAREAADKSLSQTVTANKSELQSAITANKSELQATITAVEKGANLVHLAGPYTGDGKSAVTVDLSRVNMNQYRALLFFTHSTGSGNFILASQFGHTLQASGGNVVWVFHFGNQTYSVGQYATSGRVYGVNGATGPLDWSTINSITLNNGIYCDIYAIKA